MAIPIVSGSEIQTPSAGVKLDSAALRNAALAPGRIAAAVGENVGGLFSDISLKIQQNRNARTVFDADLAMRKTKDDFTAELAKMPDESTWLPAYQQKTTALRQQVMGGKNVGPDVRRVLNEKFDIWEAATSAEIRTAALLKGTKETRDSAIADSSYAAQQGDLEGAHTILQAAVANYAMTEEDAHKVSVKFPSIAAQAQANTAIAANPIKAPELIKQFEGIIEPRVYTGIIGSANEARNRAQAQNVNDLAMMMDESPDGTIDPELLKEKVKNGEITQRASDSLLRRMTQKKNDQAQQLFSLSMMAVTEHDWVNDKKPEETARDIKDEYAGLPTALRSRLYRQLDTRVASAKRQGEAEERPVQRQIMALMREDRESNAATIPLISEEQPASKGFFGIGAKEAKTIYKQFPGGINALQKATEEEIQAVYGDKFTKKQILAAEQLHYATITQKMRDWFTDPANKDATIEQANAYRMELERPFVMNMVKQSLANPQAPKADVTKEEYEKLKPGDEYYFRGKKYLKK